ncbi:MAG: nuclear transport factor 2 family protein [Flammeovirgaceae bacterium]
MKRLILMTCLLILATHVNAQKAEQEINTFMDAWHKAAATADSEGFFGRMADDCIYIGTDKTERWLRDELKEWSKKYFARDKAWDFKPIERKVYFNKKKDYAWFNETLDTWMGVCRSSGVLQKDKKKGWLLKHYHLSVTIDNELIQGFLSLIHGAPNDKDEEKAVTDVIKKLFAGMKEGDEKMVEGVFSSDARLVTTGMQNGKPVSRINSYTKFVEGVKNKPKDQLWDEKILGYEVKIDGNMAAVWTPYEFYLNDALLHCGVNMFQLIKTVQGWEITQITDTRRKKGCQE